MAAEEIIEETLETVEEDALAPQDDLRATLEAAFKDAPQEDEAAPATTERARDEHGRFTKKVSDESPTSKVPAEPAVTETQHAISPPHSWSEEYKQAFSSLPPNVQQYILQRDTETQQLQSRQGRELSEARKFREELDPIFRNHQDMFERYRVSPAVGIQQLLHAQRVLDSDPVNALKALGASYGLKVDIAQGEQSQPGQSIPGYLSPIIQEVQDLRAWREQQEESRRSAIRNSVISEIEQFASEADSTGALKRPYMNDVHADMMYILRELKAQNPDAPNVQLLQEAYDKAVWANPQTRERMLSAQTLKSQEREKVQRAKLASSSIKSSPGAGSLSPVIGNSIRDAITQAMSEHG